MDLTPEQLQQIADLVWSKAEPAVKKYCQKLVEDLDIPDTRNLATKKHVSDLVTEALKPITEEINKTNEAVTKVASETDVKIKELTTNKSDWRDMFKTILDYES